MLVFEERGKPENPEKNKARTNNKHNPHERASTASNAGHGGGTGASAYRHMLPFALCKSLNRVEGSKVDGNLNSNYLKIL